MRKEPLEGIRMPGDTRSVICRTRMPFVPRSGQCASRLRRGRARKGRPLPISAPDCWHTAGSHRCRTAVHLRRL